LVQVVVCGQIGLNVVHGPNQCVVVKKREKRLAQFGGPHRVTVQIKAAEIAVVIGCGVKEDVQECVDFVERDKCAAGSR
jgi:uncharacterized ferredoxin-like protein